MALVPRPPLTKEIIYFCDESSFLREDTMAVAGLAIPRTNLQSLLQRIAAIPTGGYRDEVKWQTTRQWNLDFRKAFVDLLASLIKDRLAHFHIRFAQFSAYSHEGARKRFDTTSKMFYQLLLHRAVRHYGGEYKLLIKPDDGDCTSQLKKFAMSLSIDGQFKYGAHPDCISDIVCTGSKHEPFLQLLDVMLGALTAFRNGRHLLPETATAKAELAKHAVTALGIKDIARNFDDGRRLSIWNVIPQRRGPKG
jgi:hypothetical protein